MDLSQSTPALGRSHLLVRAGEQVCALPVAAVRRVVRALSVHPLPGARPELAGLAEFAGEALAVLDLSRLLGAPLGPHPAFPVTVVVWAGPLERREAVGLAADEALEVVLIDDAAVVPGAGFLRGDAMVGARLVRVLDLERLGEDA
ncbi:MAG TPA: chemotaxis protein CheW [Thermoanaerobaculia bacterium]|nr:chemotaxis protein CheW [Thermoanaerobaculia bacterium]